ncbi:hypothetical protein HYV83_05535 [Candidatus Woesearchaeota archaeon]|nr:hypothetical protein [Candidatus Woesearchaeota archaeon]
MPAILSTAKRIAGGEVSTYDITTLRVDSLEEALQQAGFRLKDSIETKRGAWEIFLRQGYSFTPFLPSQSGKLGDSGAAIYTGKHAENDSSNYILMAAPMAPVSLEEMTINAQHVSSGVIESWPQRFNDWLARDDSHQMKMVLFAGGCIVAGGLGGAGLAIATGNGYKPAAGLGMILVGAYIAGPIMAFSPFIAAGRNYLLTAARMSNAGNYAFGKEATTALDADLALLQKHRIAAEAYSALVGSGSQMNREEFWEIFTGVNKVGFSLKKVDLNLSSRNGFGEAVRVITPYASQFSARTSLA